MEFLYPIFISFVMIFLSELGDKTQLLVLSFSSSNKTSSILLGVALGTLFSHGIAILFGSTLGLLQNDEIHYFLEILTYITFIVMGLFTLFSGLFKNNNEKDSNNSSLQNKLSKFKFATSIIVAILIAIGELGDKTFLASIGLGIKYPNSKILLIVGSILGMICSNLIAIILGKFVSKKISEKAISKISGIIFLIFGILGFISWFYVCFNI